MRQHRCRICGSETFEIGSKVGRYRPQEFVLRRCPECFFSFVSNPWTDYATIYSQEYYAGRGADPTVDYSFELNHPESTIRRSEWTGITTAVTTLTRLESSSTWLDYGCGNGGLVRHLQTRGLCRAFGFEEGAIAEDGRSVGIPFLNRAQLEQRAGTFDVVTAIEVFEHVEDPITVLRQVRSLLKPGGLLFYTTGNAQPHRADILNWRYVVPEVHISFFASSGEIVGNWRAHPPYQ